MPLAAQQRDSPQGQGLRSLPLAVALSVDANGNVTSLTPPGRPAHTFSYTPVDLEQSYEPPNIGLPTDTTQYAYNLEKQLTLVTRPDGQTIQLGYEPSGGRLSTLTIPGATLTYGYHPTSGNLSSITALGSTLSYAYDGALLTSTTWTGTVTGSISRSYDNNFRISSQSVNGGNTITFGYDNDSLLTSAGAETLTRRTDNGLISGTTLGVVTEARTYSSFGEVSQSTATIGGATTFDVVYTRDKLGRITQKVETRGGVTDTLDYGYDLAERLTQVKQNDAVVASYLYDTNGNRLSRTTPSGTTLGFYDAQDRLTQCGTTTSAYTANGELASTTTSGQTTTYQYDVLGNLKSVVGPTGFTIEYVVDGQNRRIGKKVNGTLVQGWLYQNQLNPVAELDGTGAVVSRFVYGTKANVPDYMTKGGITYRIVSDHLGSPRLVINTSDGSIAQRLDYDEFGNVLLDSNPGYQPFGFAGGLSDQHTGLVRFGVRDYDALTGRWTAKDPVKFEGGDTNMYEYVLNDPVNDLDSQGLWAVKGSFYLGQGGSVAVGYADGRWFLRVGYGFGVGGGVKVYPLAKFPSTPESQADCGPAAFIGAGGGVGATLGPVGAELGGEVGGLITKRPNGKPRLSYVENYKAGVSLKGETGTGLHLGGGLDIINVGLASEKPCTCHLPK